MRPDREPLDRFSHAAVPLIDLLRFSAAAAVVYYHYCGFFRVVTPDGTNRPYLSALGSAQYGYLGVHLFFLISGFVIFRTARRKDAKSFLLARLRRLFPAYVVCCVVTWIVLNISNTRPLSLSELLYNLTMTNGIIDPFRQRFPVFVDGVYWTLAVEWKFYLLVAFGIAINWMNKLELALALWLGLAVVDAFLPNFLLQNLFIVQWSPFFVVGAVANFVQRDGWTQSRFALATCAAALAVLEAKWEFAIIKGAMQLPGSDWVAAVIVLGIILGFLALTTLRTPIGMRSSRRWALWGALSYPIYLLHCGIGGVIFLLFWTPADKFMLLGGTIIGVVIGAYAVHQLVEKNIWRAIDLGIRLGHGGLNYKR